MRIKVNSIWFIIPIRRKNEQIYFKTISRYLVCTDCPPCYIYSRASYPLVFLRRKEHGWLSTVYPNELYSPVYGGYLFFCVEWSQIFGWFFQKSLSSKRKSPVLDNSFLHSSHLLWNLNPAHERSLYWELPLGLLPLFPLDLIIWRPRRSRLALVFTRSSIL